MKLLFTPGEYKKYFKKTLKKLFEENKDPQSIAIGVAIGVAIAIIPVYGFQTVLAVAVATLFRRFKINKIAVILGSQLSIPPIAPFIFAVDYGVGNVITGKNWIWIKLGNDIFSQIGRIYILILLGSFIVAPVAFFISYKITKKLIYSLKKTQ